MSQHRFTARRHLAAAALIAAAGSAAGCGSLRENLLAPENPDVIDPSSVASADAADALRVGALSRLRNITAGGESAWLLGGLLTDEWKSSDTFFQRNETDQRSVQESNGNVQGMYRELHRARTNAREALDALRKYKPQPAASIGQMYYVIGYAELLLAETFCNGQPISDASTGTIQYGPPLSNAEIYARALAHTDSALAASTASDAFSTSVKNAAAVLKGRILVELGRFNDAAQAVAGVPTNFQDLATFSLTAGSNQIWSLNTSARRWTVGDSFDVGGLIKNALPFASAKDPRVPVAGSSVNSSAGRGFDGATNFVQQNLWGRTDATPILSGLDARLIEAEAKLNANDRAGTIAILNALRSSPQNLGAVTIAAGTLPPLTVPPSQDAAVDLYFRDKAFWTFARGQRLGDLRRLVRVYKRPQDQVFPTGQFFKGGTYGTDVSFPVTTDEQNNPNFKGCSDRNA